MKKWISIKHSRTLLVMLGLLLGPIINTLPVHALSLCSGFTECSNSLTTHGYEYHYTESYWKALSGHNCTNYVGYMLSLNGDSGHNIAMGNASEWDDTISHHPEWGYVMDNTPAVGSIAQWDVSYPDMPSGHVAYVEGVVSNDGVITITISEDNYANGPYSWRTISSNSSNYPTRFLHIKDIPTGPVAGPDDPKGNVELTSQVNGGIKLSGWALDPDTSDPIDVAIYENTGWSNPKGYFTANGYRPDIGAAFPANGSNHGFEATIPVATGTSGSKTYCAYGINVSAGGLNTPLGCRTVNLNWNPRGNIEAVTRIPGGVRVSGWTLDPDTSSPISVAVYDGTGWSSPQGNFTANGYRPDVGVAIPGYGDNHGFSTDISLSPTQPIAKTYCAYGLNIGYGSANPQLGCQSLTVSPNSIGNFETAQAVWGGARVSGWTLDPDTSSPIDIAIYDGTGWSHPLGEYASADSRPDVSAAMPAYGDLHGFDITVALTSGSHNICAYAINATGTAGENIGLGCKLTLVP